MKKTTTVLVVEDELLLLEAATKKLENSGVTAIPCSSGEAALSQIKNLSSPPDAIWLDYYLKDMNGLAFMEKVKENKAWASVPVIVVSNSASPEKVHNMLALGVDKYILKAQYRLDEIVDILHEIIEDRSTEKADETT